MQVFVSSFKPHEIYEVPMGELQKTPRYWEIDSKDYKAKLVQRWTGIVFLEAIDPYPLRWMIPISDSNVFFAQRDCTVVFDYYNLLHEFVLWQRIIIPLERCLFLFLEHTFEFLEIQSSTTVEEIREFLEY